MDSNKKLMLRLMIDHYHSENPTVFAPYLSSETLEAIQSYTIHSKNIDHIFSPPEIHMNHLHWSWIEPVILEFPTELQGYLLGILSKNQSDKLSKKIETPIKKTALSSNIRNYILNWLLSHILKPSLIPFSYLPTSPLHVLGELTKRELVELIDFLGIYDLSEEMRYIVDRHKVQTINSQLSKKKQQFLKSQLQQKVVLKTKRLYLDKRDGINTSLKLLLHKRGLIRLGGALRGQHLDFIWHLSHRLDQGRAKILEKHAAGVKQPIVTKELVQQVLKLLDFLKKKRDS